MLEVVLSSYDYSTQKVHGVELMGDITFTATPIGNRWVHPNHSVGYLYRVNCADMEGVWAWVYIPSAEAGNYMDEDMFSVVCSVADGTVFDSLGNPRGDALSEGIYHYSPVLGTLFLTEVE